MEIAGKGAVVVGGASGMGRATAELFAERGARVAVVDRAQSDGAAVAAALGGTFHALDVTDFAATETVLDDAVAALGGLHVAVNTAGGGAAQRTLGKDGPHDLDVFRRVVDLNLVATFNLNRLQAAHMARNEPEDDERGVLVNTASIAAFEGQIGQVAYTAAKAGIAGMCLTMARDLGTVGIRVTAIAPSLFETGLTRGISQERKDALVKGTAFPHRLGRPEEYAKLALAIVDNPMLNGQCLRLDAGQRFAPPMTRPLRVAVVGAGPAGVYSADALTFEAPVLVDLFERLPVPFGLLRHGVAPDHLSVKSAEAVLHAVLERPGVRLMAGVEVGRDVSPEELLAAYDVVVHAGGAPGVRSLGVPGEDLPGSLPAASFVRWYNGEPDAEACPPTGPGVAVVGAGNVALDVARLLLVDPEALLPTDVPHDVLDALRASPVTDVHLLVRRGLADVRFTLKELKELGTLPGVDVVLDPALLPDDGGEHPKPVARMLAVFREWSARTTTGAPRRLHVHARTRPVAVLGEERVEGLRVEHDGAERVLDVQTVLAAVGYLVPPVDHLPHDPDTGAVASVGTRVLRDGEPSLTEHVAGWARRGATGVLGAARSDGLDLADAVLADMPALLALRPEDPGGVAALLAARGVHVVDLAGWDAVRAAEQAHGATRGRGTVKLTATSALLAAAKEESSCTS